MAPKKIFVLGSTGPLGLLFIDKGLAAGHSLTLYVRSPQKLSEAVKNNAKVTIIQGDLTNHALLTSHLPTHDIIISFLGPNTISTPSPSLFADTYAAILAALAPTSAPATTDDSSTSTPPPAITAATSPLPRRIYALGTVSILAPEDKGSLAASISVLGVRVVGRGAYESMIQIGDVFGQFDKEQQQQQQQQGIEWTLFRVGGLGDDGKGGESGEVVETFVGSADYGPVIQRGNVAGWCVRECEKDGREEGAMKMPLLSVKGGASILSMAQWRPGIARMIFG